MEKPKLGEFRILVHLLLTYVLCLIPVIAIVRFQYIWAKLLLLGWFIWLVFSLIFHKPSGYPTDDL